MKKHLLLITVMIASSAIGWSQCNIINSVTLTVDTARTMQNKVGVFCFGTGPYDNTALAIVSDTSQWHYIAITKASNLKGQIYLDGQLVADSLFQNLTYSYSRLYLGASYYTSFSGFFNGYIDEFRMSNVVRSASDIQKYYASNAPFASDDSTIGLWHFDEVSGSSFANAVSSTAGTLTNSPVFKTGKFGNAIYFNGVNQYGNCNMGIPSSNITFEFWYKSNSTPPTGTIMICPYGENTTDIYYAVVKSNPVALKWSTGATSPSILVNPATTPKVWVNNGTCTDTMYFNSTSKTVYDTVRISTVDTLVINAVLTGINPPNNISTLKIYPNPAKTQITIDYGNYGSMTGYTLKVTNTLAQSVFNTLVTTQTTTIDLSTWTGKGVYFVELIDQNNHIIDTREIVLQ